MISRVLLALLAGLLTAATARAEPPFAARVVSVQDGDSLTVVRGTAVSQVRLVGIDCPERGQPFFRGARARTVALVLFREVSVQPAGEDDFGRLLAQVAVAGADLGTTLVREGWGWHYVRYSGDAALADAEREARAALRGVWSLPGAVPPWDWRRDRREATTASTPRPPGSGVLHGNVKSLAAHRAGCPSFDCCNCTRQFQIEAEVIAAGYHLGRCCRRTGPQQQ